MCSLSEYLFTYEGFFWILFIVCAIQTIYIRGLTSRMLAMQQIFHDFKKEYDSHTGDKND